MTTKATLMELGGAQGPLRSTPAEEIGAPDRRVLFAASHAAGAHAFIAELPEGYHTPIGDGGYVLTQSQRLRLSVARLLAADPGSVLLDDPTADLDGASEVAVLPGLEALFRGRQVKVRSASPAVHAALARAAAQVAGSHAGLAGVVHPSAPATAELRPDPALPGLHRLLDPHEMAPLLGATLDGAHVPDVRITSVRYKPGNNVVVQYSVATPGGWSTAVAFANGDSRLDAKPDRGRNRRLVKRVRGRTPSPEPLGYLPEVSAIVQWLPLDVRLPLLSEPGSRLARRLAECGLTSGADDEPELLRYWPRRRAVLRFGPHVIKVYRDAADFDTALRGLRASAGLGNVRSAPFEASIPTKLTTIQGLVPGHSPSMWPRSSEAAGVILAELHTDAVLPLPPTTADEILNKSAVRAAFVSELLPEMRGELNSLMTELRQGAPSGLPRVTCHGNFHAGQLLADPEGMTLIDVDRLCSAPAAYDLASFAAHTAFGRRGDLELVYATLDSLLAGYGARPPGVEWFLANCLLRRSPVPFRHQDEHWPEAVASLVGSARKALQ